MDEESPLSPGQTAAAAVSRTTLAGSLQLFFKRWLAGHHWRWLQTLEQALPQLVPNHAEFGDLLGHAAKDIPDRTDLSGFGCLDSWWIDHLILLRLHLSVDYVRVPQIWDTHLVPFLGVFVVFFLCFVILKWMGLAWVFCWFSVKINTVLSITLMLFWYYIEEITEVIHFNFWHAPEKVFLLQIVQKNKKNFAIY